MGGSCSSGWRGETRAGPARPCDEEPTRQGAPRHDTYLLEETFCRSQPSGPCRPPPRYPAHGVIGFPLGFPLDTISRRRPAHVEPGSATPLSPWRPWLDRAERPPGIYKAKVRGPPAPRIGTLSTADVATARQSLGRDELGKSSADLVTESCTAAATASGDE